MFRRSMASATLRQ